MSSLEFDLLLKRQENCIDDIQDVDHNNKKRVKTQLSTFASDLKDLKAIAKERHILFNQYVKKVQEDVNFKIQELLDDMSNEIAIVEQDYASLHQKVDFIADAVTKFVKLDEALGPKVEQMSVVDVKSFSNITQLLGELKELVLNRVLLLL